MECIYCKGSVIKKGVRSDNQRYRCKDCNKYFQSSYCIKRLDNAGKQMLVTLLKVGVGIRGMSKVLKICPSAVVAHIKRLSANIRIPEFKTKKDSYEIDELRTFVKSKKRECWVAYSLNRKTGKVAGFVTGARSKSNLTIIIKPLLVREAYRIYTDKLNVYPGLIPKAMHQVFERCTNKIERHNLTLRTHLKRLSRKTICYSKSKEMLDHCLRIYFWG